MDPRFELASDKYYRSKLEPVFQNVKLKLKDLLEQQKPSSISISLDGWSQFHHGYMGILCHYIHDWKRYEFTLACRPLDISHNAENIFNCLKKVLEDWEILSLVKVALRDNAPNMVAAFNEDGCSILSIGCLNHSLQLVLKDEIFSMESIKNMIEKAKKICTHASHSIVFCNRLEDKQKLFMDDEAAKKPLVIFGDCPTRWNR